MGLRQGLVLPEVGTGESLEIGVGGLWQGLVLPEVGTGESLEIGVRGLRQGLVLPEVGTGESLEIGVRGLRQGLVLPEVGTGESLEIGVGRLWQGLVGQHNQIDHIGHHAEHTHDRPQDVHNEVLELRVGVGHEALGCGVHGGRPVGVKGVIGVYLGQIKGGIHDCCFCYNCQVVTEGSLVGMIH